MNGRIVTFSNLYPSAAMPMHGLFVQERVRRVAAATGFEHKPEGLCIDELCIPLPGDGSWLREIDGANYLNLSAFAAHLDQVLLHEGNAWSLGRAPLARGKGLGAGLAPDFALRDRQGETVRLSDLRGKKILLLTWASW